MFSALIAQVALSVLSESCSPACFAHSCTLKDVLTNGQLCSQQTLQVKLTVSLYSVPRINERLFAALMRFYVIKFTSYMFSNEFYIGCHYSVIVLCSYCQSYQLFALCDPDKSLSFFPFRQNWRRRSFVSWYHKKPLAVLLLATAEKVRNDVCQCFAP